MLFQHNNNRPSAIIVPTAKHRLSLLCETLTYVEKQAVCFSQSYGIRDNMDAATSQ
jgi:hypothetical protein